MRFDFTIATDSILTYKQVASCCPWKAFSVWGVPGKNVLRSRYHGCCVFWLAWAPSDFSSVAYTTPPLQICSRCRRMVRGPLKLPFSYRMYECNRSHATNHKHHFTLKPQ